MPGPGRNQPCPCGSGRKTKHCCGEHRGPSDEQLARAHVAQLFHETVDELHGLSDHALDRLWDGLIDLPTLDLSLLVTLPKLIGPDLERLREAIQHDDPDWGWDALTAVHKQIDTPNNARDSPTRSCDCAINAGSDAGKPLTHSSISTPKAPAWSPPASSKQSPSKSALTAPLAASTSPPELSVYPGEVARKEITESTGVRAVAVMDVDLSSLASVCTFAAAFHERFAKRDVLVNNAAASLPACETTPEGFERHWATNVSDPTC